MSSQLTLSVALGKATHLATTWKNNVKSYVEFFIKSQGAFKGEKRTYQAKEGKLDDDTKRGIKLIQTTVNKKLDWLKETNKEYIDLLMSVERTNSSGSASAVLIVDGVNLGTYSSLELLRMKNLLENPELKAMYNNIPVRSDSEYWEPVTDTESAFYGTDIYQSPLVSSVAKTTEKETFVLPDPNIEKLGPGKNYTPVTATKDTLVELGDSTRQTFSGEWSQRQKAETLRRMDRLHASIIAALEECNKIPVVQSEMTGEKFFNFLNKGTI